MPRRSAAAFIVVLLFFGPSMMGCEADDDPATLPSQMALASADHHLHIRSQAASEHLDRLEIALGERDADDGEPTLPLTADDALAALDAAGIEGGAVLSNAYMFGMPEAVADDEAAKVRAENDYVATQVALHPDRLVGLCSVNPLKDYALAEVARCGADDRIAGLKVHLTNSDVDLRDEVDVGALSSVFSLADSLGLAIVVHMRTRAEDYGAQDVEVFVDRVLSHAPSVPIQIAHMAGWGGYDDATDSALGAFAAALEGGRLAANNITFGLGAVVFNPEAAGADTALAEQVRASNERLAEKIRELGIERVVYATDWPSWPPVTDITTGIDRNAQLLRSALPLTEAELDRLFANVGPMFRASGP